jgi:hypothetical protein
MDSPSERLPFSVPATLPGQQAIDSVAVQESGLPVRTDRLYQIAAVAAGLILLITAF